jgi:hypothetical protein
MDYAVPPLLSFKPRKRIQQTSLRLYLGRQRHVDPLTGGFTSASSFTDLHQRLIL